MQKALFFAITILLVSSAVAYSHGVTFQRLAEHTVTVRFSYADGEPMSYVEVKVLGPESTPDLEFQNGRTDARGIFAFVPSIPGKWIIEAWDNMGHKSHVETTIQTAGENLKNGQAQQPDTNEESLSIKILLGLSFIANLVFLCKCRQNQGSNQS